MYTGAGRNSWRAPLPPSRRPLPPGALLARTVAEKEKKTARPPAPPSPRRRGAHPPTRPRRPPRMSVLRASLGAETAPWRHARQPMARGMGSGRGGPAPPVILLSSARPRPPAPPTIATACLVCVGSPRPLVLRGGGSPCDARVPAWHPTAPARATESPPGLRHARPHCAPPSPGVPPPATSSFAVCPLHACYSSTSASKGRPPPPTPPPRLPPTITHPFPPS